MKKRMALATGYLVRRTSVFQQQPIASNASETNLGGHVVGAPSGSPARILRITQPGRGKNRITRYLVEVDYAGRTWLAWIDPDNFSEEKQNPRRRAKRNPRRQAARLYPYYVVGARTFSHLPAARRYAKRIGQPLRVVRNAQDRDAITLFKNPKRRQRGKISYYQRRLQRASRPSAKRAARKTRQNPTARRSTFVVKVRRGSTGAFRQLAAFNSKPQAFDYARALARLHPTITVAVEVRK